MRHSFPPAIRSFALVLLLCSAAAAADFNYGEALQKGLFFFECQESGRLSPGNRVEWRADAHLEDGQDIGRDLSGGWYDAGDHWKANTTMAAAATRLAWAMIGHPASFAERGQVAPLLNSLRFVGDYFERCVVDGHPGSASDFSDYAVYIDVAGKTTPAAPEPSVHTQWCGPEATDGYTVREALKVTTAVPGSDVAARMAAAFAAMAIVRHRHGDAADRQTAARHLGIARKLWRFADTWRSEGNRNALRPDGSVVALGYRSEWIHTDLLWGAIWLHRAEKALATPGYGDASLLAARRVLDELADAGRLDELTAWWRERAQHLTMAWLQTDHSQEDRDRLLPPLQEFLRRWREADPDAQPPTSQFYHTPHGLKVRKVHSGTFSGHHVFNTIAVASLYADWIAATDPSEAALYRDYVKSQADYFLGANQQGISYVIGFGTAGWPDTWHHNGAAGAWNAFGNRIASDPTFQTRCRHISHGALLGGPDGNDAYPSTPWPSWTFCEPTIGANGDFVLTMATLIAAYPAAYPTDPTFPAPEPRSLTLDPLTTDREFYVAARRAAATTSSLTLEVEAYNRSAWPIRITTDASCRYYFRADRAGMTTSDFTLTVTSSEGGVGGGIHQVGGDLFYAVLAFPGERLYPNNQGGRSPAARYRRRATLRIATADASPFDSDDDPSAQGLDGTMTVRPAIPVFEGAEHLAGSIPVTGATRRIDLGLVPASAAAGLVPVLDPDSVPVQDRAAGAWRFEGFAPGSDLGIGFVPEVAPLQNDG